MSLIPAKGLRKMTEVLVLNLKEPMGAITIYMARNDDGKNERM